MMTCRGFSALIVILLLSPFSLAQEPADESDPSFWMKKKLEYSEKILAGLVNRDFSQIAKTAHSMGALSQVEKWVHGNTKEYRAQLQVFQNANDQLKRMAETENLDGAALAYVQLSLSCVNCHKILRDGQLPAAVPAK